MKVIAFPKGGTAYTEAFYQEVTNQGASVIEGDWSLRWLIRNVGKVDAVHINWPSFLYAEQATKIRLVYSFFRYTFLLMLVRTKTKNLFWTAHNLLPHKASLIPEIDVWARRILIALSRNVFVHGKEAGDRLVERFPLCRKKICYIPHGNWIRRYGGRASKVASRKELGLPDSANVYLFFGYCVPYKNLEFLVRTFKNMEAEDDFLLVAGKFWNDRYYNKVVEEIGDASNIRLDAKFIPDSDVAAYFSSADAFCIPYREVLTSGSAMLGLSFGVPVISVDTGFLRDIVDSETGILVSKDDENSLKKALVAVKCKAWDPDKIVAKAKDHRFEDAAFTFLARCSSSNPIGQSTRDNLNR